MIFRKRHFLSCQRHVVMYTSPVQEILLTGTLEIRKLQISTFPLVGKLAVGAAYAALAEISGN